MKNRNTTLSEVDGQVFDVLVVGGGITGAGVAREAAWSGFSTLMVEKADIASGTSSRSSKLLHGGLRYLENYEFGLVAEAVRERMAGYRLAPHLVKPLPFLFPQYQGDRPGMNIMAMGLWLYDAMAGFRSFGLHKRLNAADFAAAAPGIDTKGLKGGFRYFDAQTDDARLALEVVLDAAELGAGILNWTNLKAAKRVGDLWVCTLLDRLTDKTIEVRARNIALCAGPWLDRVTPMFEEPPQQRMRPTKGVHLLVSRERFPLHETVVVLHPRDGRVTFAIPSDNSVVIGTSDTDHPTPEREPEVTAEDIAYILEGPNHMFPGLDLQPRDVHTSYAGLRPLIYEGHKSESEVSREHEVFHIADGVVAIGGGKYTTWRVMATDVLKPIRKRLKSEGLRPARSRRGLYKRLLPGGRGLQGREELLQSIPARAKQWKVSETTARSLLEAYGARAADVVAYCATQEGAMEVVGQQELPLGVFRYAVEHELACSLDDLLRRRSKVFYVDPDQGRSFADRVAEYVAPVAGWNSEKIALEVKRYTEICDHFLPQGQPGRDAA